jgi:catechol 2,3-dioxygenase-like lactoylglutathione lyase family enzyme
MRFFLWMAALASLAMAQQTPVTTLAGARFRVADLAKAREFYTKVFGFEEVQRKSADVAAFRVTGNQVLEFVAGAAKDPLEILYLGVSGQPPEPLKDPEGHQVQFVRATGADKQGQGVSTHLLHIGMGVTELAGPQEFYSSHFGGKEIFRRPDNQIVILRLPGQREDWVEFIVRQPQGSQDHICLGVPDIQKAYQTLVDRGAEIRGKPRVASNGYWVINMADTNGLRVELMEPHPAKK